MRRRKAREAALQILYSLDTDSGPAPTTSINGVMEQYYKHFCDRRSLDDGFLKRILAGIIANFHSFDEQIEKESEHWRLARMAMVDRNILRIAIFELVNFDDVPSSVTINEAVEVAKLFGTEESGSFINGILDHIWKNLPPNPHKVEH